MPTIELTTIIGCPLDCVFCPQDALRKAYATPPGRERRMSLAMLDKILDWAPPHVRIDFSGFSEPWSNPDCNEMLRRVLAARRTVAIYTTLHGMKDAPAVTAMLREHRDQVETVVIHLPDATDNMRGHRDSDTWRKALVEFEALRGFHGMLIEFMTMHGLGAVHPSAGDAAALAWLGNTRAGNLPDVGPLEITPRHCGPITCGYTPFYDQNVVLPDGSVVLCCMDYGLKHVLGSVLVHDYYSLFALPGMSLLRADSARTGHCEDLICSTCSRAQRWEQNAGAKQVWDKVEAAP